MYFSKNPTHRKNCHYLVLFINPVDKQQVMVLTRQMYPTNSQELLRHFEDRQYDSTRRDDLLCLTHVDNKKNRFFEIFLKCVRRLDQSGVPVIEGKYNNFINGRDVQRKNVVNNADKSSLWAT